MSAAASLQTADSAAGGDGSAPVEGSLQPGAGAPSGGPPAAAADGTAPAQPNSTAPQSPWRRLEADYLHDPQSPAMRYLQEPAEALSQLPPAQEGNHVDWVAALRQGDIEPRTNINPETKVNVLDLDILFEETAGMPMVLFPHRPHTEWLDCKNCHDKLFIAKKGANKISMLDVLNGNFCGQCHGAVAFPITQCFRCHSVPRGSAQQVGTQ